MLDKVNSTKYLEYINSEGLLLAIIIYPNYKKEENSIEFFTESDYSQQLGYMFRPRGYKVDPHIHKPVERIIAYTQEVLYIKRGKVKIDFYNNNKDFLDSRVLSSGSVILLALGGHGLEMLEDSEIIEVKQGPYAGDKDKERFKNKFN